MPRIDVRILGRPQVVIDGVVAPLTGRLLLLTLRLAIAGHHPLAPSRCLEAWPEDEGSDGALRVALTRLRRTIGPQSVVRLERGYTLAPTAHVDADRFETLLQRGADRTLGRSDRIGALEEAIRLRDGPAYESVERLPWVEAEAVRLDELYEQAVDRLAELRLEAGEAEGIVPQLLAAVERAPYREHRVGLLALALYRSNRQREALATLRAASRRLRDEAGLTPGPSLAALERRILGHDASLAGSTDPAVAGGDPPSARSRAALALLRAGAADEALPIAEAAVETARTAHATRDLAHALLVTAAVATELGTSEPAAMIDEARSLARELNDGALLAKAALARFGSGIPPDKTVALVELAEPLDLLPESAPERVELLCAAAAVISFVGGGPAAQRIVDAAERAYAATGSSRAEAIWCSTRAIVSAIDRHPRDEVASWADRALHRARDSGDPQVVTVALQAVLRAAYMGGDLCAVDRHLEELDDAAERARLPFGQARVTICRATNALARGQLDRLPELIADERRVSRRLGTHATERAARGHELLLAREHGTLGASLDDLRALAAGDPRGVWVAVAAAHGTADDLDVLRATLDTLRRDDTFSVAAAFAALAAQRHDDRELAEWAAGALIAVGDSTAMLGFGSIVLGFASHFLGICHFVLGALDEAHAAFSRAADLADEMGARLWHADSAVMAALVRARSADPDTRSAADRFLAEAADWPVVRASARLTALATAPTTTR